MANSSSPLTKQRKPTAVPRPSSSILLLSPTNQVLLLHRVQTSTSFSSAHVFPGGNLSPYHEGPGIPAEGSPSRHRDGPHYRMAAIRETFEECGILLARPLEGRGAEGGLLLRLTEKARLEGRKAIHEKRVSFPDWLRSVGGVADTENLLPWTRWITPVGPARRYTTQMYLYLLPLDQSDGGGEQAGRSLALDPSASSPGVSSSASDTGSTLIPAPTHDGGLEHTAASFDDAAAWLACARDGRIIVFPPQIYLLTLLADLTGGIVKKLGGGDGGDTDATGLRPGSRDFYQAQRDYLLAFLKRMPTSRPFSSPAMMTQPSKAPHPTAGIPWSEKAISPVALLVRKTDRRVVLGLDKAGPELEGSDRGGDWDRVVLVKFDRGVPTQVEIRWREDVFREERGAQGGDEQVTGEREKHRLGKI